MYLAVWHGLHEVHRSANVHIRGSGAEAEVVTSVEPTAELPVFIGFPDDVFNPKAGTCWG